MSKKKDFASMVSVTDDPIEIHLLNYLEKLQQQNIRLKAHIDKTASWTHLKEVTAWKPYDFYHYFCSKYQEKYKKEFRLTGSIVRAYNRIEAFIREHKLDAVNYREFIDLAFSRYFNIVVVPVIGNICSISLYERLMGVVKRPETTEEMFKLEEVIALESASFEEEIEEEGIYES